MNSAKLVKCQRVIGQMYDGSQLRPMFCYEESKGESNVVIFIGSMEVGIDKMVDYEDVINDDDINSMEAINIVAELPFVNLVGGVALQRIMIRTIVDTFYDNIPQNTIVEVQGDDIKFTKPSFKEMKKLSVSITTNSANATLIHIGLNIDAGELAPSFAGNLSEVGVTDIEGFIEDLCLNLEKELNDIYQASMKVLPK